MNQGSLAALRAILYDDFDSAIMTAFEYRCLTDLLDAMLQEPNQPIDWLMALRVANAMDDSKAAYWTIVNTADNLQDTRDLAEAIVTYARIKEEGEFPRLEYFENTFYRLRLFDCCIKTLSLDQIRDAAQYRFGKSLVPIWTTHRAEHFLKHGDLKRAYDEMIRGTKLGRPALWPLRFAQLVERIWFAHRNKGLVEDIDLNHLDWRCISIKREIRVGQVRKGRRSACVVKKLVDVPHLSLWAGGRRQPNPQEMLWLTMWYRADAWTRGLLIPNRHNQTPLIMSQTGAMLRDLIWFWHNKEKERKLQTFCKKHGLEYTAP